MKKSLVNLMLALTLTSLVADAIARPMGGRRSFGRQSTNVQRQVPPATPAAPVAAPGVNRPAAAPVLSPAVMSTVSPVFRSKRRNWIEPARSCSDSTVMVTW